MRILCIILELLLFTAACAAQAPKGKSVADSSSEHGILIVDPGVSLGKSTLLLPPLLYPELRFESFILPYGHSGIRQPFLQLTYEKKLDLLTPYILQTRHESELTPLYILLGAAELGGAAYIGYQHIKKYGFAP